jgi:hypothetical protein
MGSIHEKKIGGQKSRATISLRHVLVFTEKEDSNNIFG